MGNNFLNLFVVLFLFSVGPVIAQQDSTENKKLDNDHEQLLNPNLPSVDESIDILRNKNSSIDQRIKAIEALRKHREKAANAIPMLIDQLNDSDSRIQRAASSALIAIGEKSIPALLERIEHDNSNTRISAAFCLGSIRPSNQAVVEKLKQALNDKETSVVLASAEALGRIGPDAKSALDDLALLNNSQVEQIRAYSVYAICNISPQNECLKWLKKALNDESNIVRSVALSLVNQNAADFELDESLVSSIRTSLKDKAAQNRFAAARILIQNEIADDQIFSIISEELSKPYYTSGPVIEVIKSLGVEYRRSLADDWSKIVGRLGEIMNQPGMKSFSGDYMSMRNDAPQLLAANALVGFGEDAITHLKSGLAHEHYQIRIASANALGEIGQSAASAIDELLKLIEDDVEEVRYSAVEATLQIGKTSESTKTKLQNVFINRLQSDKSLSSWALGELGPAAKDAVPHLILLFEHNDRNLNEVVSIALTKIGKPAVPKLINNLNNENLRSFALSVDTLAKMGRTAIPALKAELTSDASLVKVGVIRSISRMIRINSDNVKYSEPAKAADAKQTLKELDQLIPILIDLLADDDAKVQKFAKATIVQFGPKSLDLLRLAAANQTQEKANEINLIVETIEQNNKQK